MPREPSLHSQAPGQNDLLLQLEHLNESAVFYPGRQHGKHLDLLLHLSRYSNLLLTVTGPTGSGKTHLKNRLVQQLDSGVAATQIDARKAGKANQLLALLAQQLKLDLPPQADAAQHLSSIRNYSALLNEDGGSCLILIDNAERLEQDALNLLLDLATTANDNKRPHIALFGRESLFEQLNNKDNLSRFESVGHHIPLEAFSEIEARGYLENRCRSVGIEPLPLNDRQLQQIYKASQGWPGALNTALLDELARSTASEPKTEATPAKPQKKPATKPKKKKNRRTPLLPIIAVAVLISLLAVGFIYKDGFRSSSALQGPDIISRSQDIRRDTWQPPLLPEADEEINLEPDAPETSLPADTPETTTTDTPDAQAPSTSTEQPVTAAPQPTNPASTQLDLPDDTPATTAAPRPATPAQQPAATTPAVTPAPPAPARPTPGSTASSSYRDQGFRREALLMNKPASHFTLQMMGSLDEASVRSFIQTQANSSDFAYFEGRYQGRPWYVVVYGDYNNREQALAAIQNLPAPLRNQRPWARTFQSVQSDIRSR